jgi:hypothetical protein
MIEDNYFTSGSKWYWLLNVALSRPQGDSVAMVMTNVFQKKVQGGSAEVVFCSSVIMSKVEEAKHEQTMPNEERVEPIE